MNTSRISLTALCGALAGFSALPLFGQAPDTQNPAPVSVAQSQGARVPRFSAGLDDIVKLTKARVDESVILAYVQASRVAYRPNAQEIIRLREAGVSGPVITAVVERGAELRRQTAEVAKAVKPVAPPPAKVQPREPTPVAPAASSPTVFVAPDWNSTAPSTVVYTGYPTYRYPGWYGYSGWSYPGYYGSYPYSCYPRYSGWYSYGSCYPRYGGSYFYPSASFGVRVGGGYHGGGYGGGGYHGGGHYGGAHFSGGYRGGAPAGGVHSVGFRGGFRR